MWMFHCHIEPHLASGMYTHYRIEPAETLSQRHDKTPGPIRHRSDGSSRQ